MENWSVELDPSEIKVNRDDRQRRALVGIEDLAASIAMRGQLQPVVITRDHVLVAGERRHAAISSLSGRKIRCTYTDEIDPGELQALEFEENSKRIDLTWQDNCNAILTYHEYRASISESWTMEATGSALGLSVSEVSQRIAVAREIRGGNKMVAEAPKLSTAKGLVSRSTERRQAAETSQLLAMTAKPKAVSAAPVSSDDPMSEVISDLNSGATGYILNDSFINWSADYDGPKFNLIHCDFPYGVGMHKSDQGSGDAHGTYEDTPEIYWSLVDALLNNLDNFCADSAHLMFWFSMDYYEDTRVRLGSRFKVNPFPLVWVKDDNSGILPDANRGPRRTYETAFLASRGDRKIVRPVSNHVASPIQRGRHMSEKPQKVLGHYFRMLVDEHSAVLDPTCGSGSAIRAAITAGASQYLGLEINTEFADHADETLKRFLEEQE
jgi:ParB/RepB/Spo0J family partition protein